MPNFGPRLNTSNSTWDKSRDERLDTVFLSPPGVPNLFALREASKPSLLARILERKRQPFSPNNLATRHLSKNDKNAQILVHPLPY